MKWDNRGRRAASITYSRILALTLAVLLVVGAVGPVTALDSSTVETKAEPDSRSPLISDEVEQFDDDSPALKKVWARMLLTNVSQSGNDDTYQRALTLLNKSIEYISGPARVSDERAFKLDAKVVKALKPAGKKQTDSEAIRASRLIATADNETAAKQLAIARWALNQTSDELHTGVKQSSKAHIRNAERALERGQNHLVSTAESDFDGRAQAIHQFRVAWIQATKAINRIDDATSPEVRITTRGDPRRNGSEPITGQIRGEVFDIQPSDLQNITVTIGGDRTRTAPINVTGRQTNATFAVNVTLEDRITSVNVSVTENTSVLDEEESDAGENESGEEESGQPDSDEKNTNKGKNKGKNKSENKKEDKNTDKNDKPGKSQGSSNQKSKNGQTGKKKTGRVDKFNTGYDIVYFDGDGLPDLYEVEFLGTDPRDPDSDSSKVSGDLGDNGVIDSLEDFDGDGVSNYHEGVFATDPFAADTDGDRLPDGFEIGYSQLNPTFKDSNNDSVPDGKWDIDDDGVTNYEEFEAGTNPVVADEDGDGLDDRREIEVGTNASDPDTDDDGLTDKEELELGTDPLSADSNGDGVLDGNQTRTTTATNESLNVNVSLRGTGNVANGVSVDNGSLGQFDRKPIRDAQVTSFVDITSERSFESASITFSYTEAQLGNTNESDLVVFRYNQTLEVFEPLNTSVDADENSVTAETSHFSRFVVFDVRNWASNFLAKRPANETEQSMIQPLDVIFIIDSSGSIRFNDPKEFRKKAAKEFVGALIDGDRAGVVDFDGDARVAQKLTTDFGAVNLTIDKLDAFGGTNIGAGVQQANAHFAEASNASRAKFAILLTDGQGSGGRQAAEVAAERNITIYTIGFGGANENKLQDIANITGGNYTYVDSASDLPNVFSRVAEDIGSTDTDGDGIPDYVERGGVPTRSGLVFTDPYSADTDEDGLDDRTELGMPTDVASVLGDGSDGGDSTDQQSKLVQTIAETLQLAGYDTENATNVYLDPVSDPTNVDTDEDGLDDYTEVRESTRVDRTTSATQTRQVLRKSESSGGQLGELFETYQRTTEADLWDSDFDGVTDGRERELGTDPTKSDTDGDGIADAEELARKTDPTLFDARPPKITVIRSGYSIPENSLDLTFEVRARVTDAAGVETVALVKGGSVRTEATIGSRSGTKTLNFTQYIGDDAKLDTSDPVSTFVSGVAVIGDTVADSIKNVGDVTVGSTVYVRATDTNDNRGRVVGVRQENFFAAIAGELFKKGLSTPIVAEKFGQVSGFSASVGSVFKEVSAFIDNPEQVIEGLQTLYTLVVDEGPIDGAEALVTGLVRDVQRKQEQNNPYGTAEDKDNAALYDTFRTNWYRGYAAGFLVKIALGGASNKALEAVKKSDRVSAIASRLEGTGALRALKTADNAVEAAKSRVAARILLRVDGVSAALLRQADSAGSVFRLSRLRAKIDGEIADSQEGTAIVGRILTRTGRADESLIDDFELCNSPCDSYPDALEDLTESVDGVDSDDAVALGVKLERLTDRGLIDGESVESLLGDIRSLNNPNPNADAILRTLVENDEIATRFVARYEAGDIDKDSIRRFDGLLDNSDLNRQGLDRLLRSSKTADVDLTELSETQLLRLNDVVREGDDTSILLLRNLDQSLTKTFLETPKPAKFAEDLADLDAVERLNAVEAIASGKVDIDGPYVTEGVPQAISLRDFARQYEESDVEISDADIASLARGMGEYADDVEYDDLSGLEKDLRELKDFDGDDKTVDGLGGTINDATPTDPPGAPDISGFKGMTGEIRGANNLLDSEVDPEDLTIERSLGEKQIRDIYNDQYEDQVVDMIDDNEDFKRLNQDTDVDIDPDAKVTINGEKIDSPAIEIKNRRSTVPPEVELKRDLERKLSTWGAAGEDDMVVALPQEYLDEYGDQLSDLESDIINNLEELDSNTNADINTDVNIRIVSIDELDT